MIAIRAIAIAAVTFGTAFLPTTAPAATLTTLYSFKGHADGSGPQGRLVYVGGFLYGTTAYGGPTNAGTVFKIEAATGAETVLHGFVSGADGGIPVDGLIYVNGVLYGTTGGQRRVPIHGTVFKVNPSTGVFRTLYQFGNGYDGAYPYTGLTYQTGFLYGTGFQGGTSGVGVIYRVDATTGTESVPYSFPADGTKGTGPEGVMSYNAGLFYGTVTQNGGPGFSGKGAVFKFNPATKVLSILHRFGAPNDGSYPNFGLIYESGTLYGATPAGGLGTCSYGCGTVFKLDPVSGAETVIYRFTGSADQGAPSGMPLFVQGQLYGTTGYSQAGGAGSIYQVDPTTGAETTLYAFNNGTNGGFPRGQLIYQNGAFYGTTSYGGASGGGTVFKLTL